MSTPEKTPENTMFTLAALLLFAFGAFQSVGASACDPMPAPPSNQLHICKNLIVGGERGMPRPPKYNICLVAGTHSDNMFGNVFLSISIIISALWRAYVPLGTGLAPHLSDTGIPYRPSRPYPPSGSKLPTPHSVSLTSHPPMLLPCARYL